MAKNNKMLINIVVMTAVICLCSGSAIPMWEYLSRGEKMSHLYSMFAKQVSAHCKSNVDVPVAQCKRDLLVFGVDKLEKMSDLHLDAMDPYQRGANDIIWDSMMDGHRTKPQKKSTNTPSSPIRVNVGTFAPNPLFADDRNNDASAQQNEASSSSSSAYAMGMDNTYDSYNYPTAVESLDTGREPQNHLFQEPAATSLHLNYAASQQAAINTNFLSGPMVFRVRPDGSPVEEDQRKPLPRDDDREAMTIGKEKIPTVQQIAANNFGGGSFVIVPAPTMQAPAMPSSMPLRRTVFATYRTTDRRFRQY